MDVRKEMEEILLSDPDKYILLWEEKDGWKVVADGCRSLCRKSLAEKGITGLLEIVSEADRELCEVFLQRVTGGCTSAKRIIPLDEARSLIHLHLRMEDGQYRFVRISCQMHKNESGETDKMLVTLREVTAEENYRLELAQTITNDKNPAYFVSGAQRLMQMHPESSYAVIQFDIAKFKIINEQYGEETGDEIIRYFIHTLALICNENQLYARLTADVFMILTPYEIEEDIYALIRKIDKNLLGYREIPYKIFYGVCYVTDPAQSLRKYGDNASFARQYVKGNALHHIGFFQEDMKEKAIVRKTVEDNMERALREHEFVMFLQPKYSISQNRMIGAEALVRWMDPKRGMIPPMDFIPAFEENGFVIKLDYFMWEEACKVIRAWLDEGLTPVPVSVNVSRKHLKSGEFVEVLNRLVDKYRIKKEYLEIEITETLEDLYADQGIRLLKENGYVLLMDDFGSGYSSLNTLKNTRFDVIKIDRGFLQDAIGSERGKKIVAHTIQMTRDIGLDTVAEGVETQEQADFLGTCGCDMAQGFYYAKPMPVEQFHELFRKENC